VGNARFGERLHPRVVQERLGHSTIAITLGIYIHFSPTLHDDAAEVVSRLMISEMEPT
jgi:integrase